MIDVRGVKKSYGGVTAVDGVSVRAERAAITSIIGPNGAGKTTLLNLMCGLDTLDKGSIQFEGRDITGWSPHKVAEVGIARTFQTPELFGDMTVRDNVRVGLEEGDLRGFFRAGLRLPGHRRQERANMEAVTYATGVTGLGDVLDVPATELSYGMQRRVELARALAGHPRLLMLDEPMAGLSNEESQEISSLLGSIRREGIACLMVEHHVEAVMGLSDRVIVLNFGSVLAQGPPEMVRQDPQVIEAYLGTEVTK